MMIMIILMDIIIIILFLFLLLFSMWSLHYVCSRHDFFTIIDLPVGLHQYKYFVDGQWHCDDKEVSCVAYNLLPLLWGGYCVPWVCLFVSFRVHDLSIFCVCFVLPFTGESFPFMFWRWRNKLKWAPLRVLLPLHYCNLGAGSIPFKTIVN